MTATLHVHARRQGKPLSGHPAAGFGITPALAAFAAGLVLLLPGATRAEVRRLDAAVTTTVLERLPDGTAGSSSESYSDLGETDGELPVEAEAALGSFVSGGPVVTHGGSSRAEIGLPTLVTGSNPGELAVEVVCHSAASSPSYRVDALAREDREVLLSPADLGVTQSGETNQVISSAYLGGTILLWSGADQADLGQTISAGLELRILGGPVEAAVEDDVELFVSSVGLRMLPQGGVILDQDGRTAGTSVMGPDELLAGGQDLPTELAELSGLGAVYMLVVPAQALTYEYTVQADVPFRLRAEVQARASNGSGQSGAAVVFGRGFQKLSVALEPLVIAGHGTAVTQAVNTAAQARADAVSYCVSGAGNASVCGSGVFAALALSGIALAGSRWRTRRA